jgi:hypothetical protein
VGLNNIVIAAFVLRPAATGSTARTRDEGSRFARWSTRARKRSI